MKIEDILKKQGKIYKNLPNNKTVQDYDKEFYKFKQLEKVGDVFKLRIDPKKTICIKIDLTEIEFRNLQSGKSTQLELLDEEEISSGRLKSILLRSTPSGDYSIGTGKFKIPLPGMPYKIDGEICFVGGIIGQSLPSENKEKFKKIRDLAESLSKTDINAERAYPSIEEFVENTLRFKETFIICEHFAFNCMGKPYALERWFFEPSL